MIFTFYSYKGGVGRSMAMANVADALARRGLKVCMVDFDLEAPGIEAYFPVDANAVRGQDGLLDLLLTYKRAMAGTGPEDAFTRLDTFLFPIYRRLPGGGLLDLLPAGRRGDAQSLSRYAAELQRFDWHDFFFNWAGSRFFEWLRRRLGDRYDVVLVDSRTGVTEMGGVCAYQLADTIVALCAPNRQNVNGTTRAIADFTSPRVRAQRSDRPLSIVVVPSRVEMRAEAEVAQFKARFNAAFAGFEPDGVLFWDLVVPYEPAWAFDESTAGRIDPKKGGASAYAPLIKLMMGQGDYATLIPEPAARSAAPVQTGAPAPAPAVRSNISFNPTQSVAPADLMLFHPFDCGPQANELEAALRKQAIRVQRVAAPASPDRHWARSVQWATQFSANVVVFDAPRLGPAADTLRQLSKVPVLSVPASDDLAEALYFALAKTTEAPRDLIPALAALLRPADEDSTTEDVPVHNPYVGARAYEESDAGWFFGRDDDVQAIIELLRTQPVVTLCGASGSGKSSLVRAGLLPALRTDALGPDWQAIFTRATPTLDALGVLQAARQGAKRLVFMLDDVELLPIETRQALVAQASETVRVLLVARADRTDTAEGAIYSLKTLERDEMRAAIVGVADRAGVGLEEGLLDRIVDDLQSVVTPLSALQSIMRALFKTRRAGWLTHAAYEHTGYATGKATADRAEATWMALSAEAQAGAEAMFKRLVSAEGEPRTVDRDALPSDAPIDAFLQARVLWAGRRADEPVYRLTDGRLAERWSRLSDWLTEDASFVRWLDFVQTVRLAGDDQPMTWGELGKAEAFAASHRLAPAEAAFVAQAQQVEADKAMADLVRGRRTRKVALVAFTVMATLASFLILQSMRVGDAADQHESIAALSEIEAELNTDAPELDAIRKSAEVVARKADRAGRPVDKYWAELVAADALHRGGDEVAAKQMLYAARSEYEQAPRALVAAAFNTERVEQRAADLEQAFIATAPLGWAELFKARFVLIIELTTLCAWTNDAAQGLACHDFMLRDGVWAKWREGWRDLLHTTQEHGGKVVLVSRSEAPTEALLLKATLAGKPLEQTGVVAGMINPSQLDATLARLDRERTMLVLSAEVGAQMPSKNLYVLDRVDHDALCGGASPRGVITDLPKFVRLLDRAAGTQRPKQPFITAFYPYSEAGRREIERRMRRNGIDHDAAERQLYDALRRRAEERHGQPPKPTRPRKKSKGLKYQQIPGF